MTMPKTQFIFNLAFKTKADSIAYNLKVLENSLQVCYPDRWDISLRSETCAEVQIWFPVLQITNSAGTQHTITDLLVYFCIDLLTSRVSNGYGEVDLRGVRMSGTKKEIEAGYTHSHLSTSDFASSGSFCFGAAKIKLTMLEISSENKPVHECIEKIEYFLIQLEEYLSWESIEGTPHRRMSSIGVRTIYFGNIHRDESYLCSNAYRNIDSTLGINPLILRKIFKSFVLRLFESIIEAGLPGGAVKNIPDESITIPDCIAMINIVAARNHPGVVIELSEEGCNYLIDIIIEERQNGAFDLANFLCLEDDSGRLSTYTHSSEIQVNTLIKHLKNRFRKFRNLEIYFTVINDEKPKEKENERFYQRLRPRFKKLFEAYLTIWFNAYKLGKNQTSKDSKDNSTEW